MSFEQTAAVFMCIMALAGASALAQIKYRIDHNLDLNPKSDRSLWYFISAIVVWAIMPIPKFVGAQQTTLGVIFVSISSTINDGLLLAGVSQLDHSPRLVRTKSWPKLAVVAASIVLLITITWGIFDNFLPNTVEGIGKVHVWQIVPTAFSMVVGILLLISLFASLRAYGFSIWNPFLFVIFAMWIYIQPIHMLFRSTASPYYIPTFLQTEYAVHLVSIFGIFVLLLSLFFLSTSWLVSLAARRVNKSVFQRRPTMSVPQPIMDMRKKLENTPDTGSRKGEDSGKKTLDTVRQGKEIIATLKDRIGKDSDKKLGDWVAVDTSQTPGRYIYALGHSSADAEDKLKKKAKHAFDMRRVFITSLSSVLRAEDAREEES